jgi:two-component system cell cycle response regulator
MSDLETQNRKLRQRLTEITNDAKHNDDVLRRFHERELELLTSESLPELLYSITDGLKHSFKVESISLVLHDSDHELRHLLHNTGVPAEAFSDVQFVDSFTPQHSICTTLERPWLGPYLSPEHNILFPSSPTLQSVALVPIIRHQKLYGTLNFGSSSTDRFTRHHACDFLHRLATIGGVCLENATNHERLLITGMTDALTGLHNRRYLDRRLNEEVSRTYRYHQSLSCIFVDADHFKRVNDNHGHAAGDAVLREISSRIQSCLRASDIAVRYGGEEFCLILPQTCLFDAKRLAERIRLKIAAEPIPSDNGSPLNVTISLGVSELPEQRGEKVIAKLGEELISNADAALYDAKANGRNQVASKKKDSYLMTASQ